MARTSKALAAWIELNDRQQGTLAVIYELDQAVESARRRGAARGDFDSTPASVWRAIDFAHEPSDRRTFGITEMQMSLATRGWDNQGNGSTLAALVSRGLIEQDWRPTTFGRMHMVRLTREGRAAARAGTTTMPGGEVRKAALSQRSWEVLALLWAADVRGTPLKWGYSKTVEHVLIDKHVPPLASSVIGGYEITERGRDFYREHYAAHVAAHPDVQALHPQGGDAEPWSPKADEILTWHRQYHQALCTTWRSARDAQQSAEQEAAAAPARLPQLLPAAVVDQVAARHRLWQDTARQRADLAATQVEDLREQAARAARAYAAAALTVFKAAVSGSDPLDGLEEPETADGTWDEQRLAPPAETGVHAIDAEAKKLYAAAVGTPLRRRGPAPKHRTRTAAIMASRAKLPGCELAALADFLHEHTAGGALLRRLYPVVRASKPVRDGADT